MTDPLFWLSLLLVWSIGTALICAVVLGAATILGLIKLIRRKKTKCAP